MAAAQPALIFYLAAYAATTLGTFAVAAWVGRQGDECLCVDDWSGIARRRPALALAMTLFLLSLAGVPPTGGFFAKFYLFRAAVERPELVWLVVAAVLSSVISVYYYLRIVVAMYFRDRAEPVHGYPSIATGAGLSYGGGSHEFPDSSLWLNLDLAGLEFRGRRGLVLFIATGTTIGLAGGTYMDPIQNDCGKTYCRNAVGKFFPQMASPEISVTRSACTRWNVRRMRPARC